MNGFFKDVLEGRVRDVKKWLEKGQNLGAFDQYGNTAIHLAAEKGFRGVCKVLIDGGADVNQRNTSVGWTAVHYAAYEGHVDVLRMLLAHGAVPDLQDKAGDSPLSYAKEWNNTECVKVLEEAIQERRQRTRQTRVSSKSMSKSSSMCGSEGLAGTSDDSDFEDEDESSMMNWVMPQPDPPRNIPHNFNLNFGNPQFPANNLNFGNPQQLQANNLNQGFGSPHVQHKDGGEAGRPIQDQATNQRVDNKATANQKSPGMNFNTLDSASANEIVNVTVAMPRKVRQPEEKQVNQVLTPTDETPEKGTLRAFCTDDASKVKVNGTSDERCSPENAISQSDLSTEDKPHEDECKTERTIVPDEDEDSDSEDTLGLLQQTNAMLTRESTPSNRHLNSVSIVDRIKSSLSPTPHGAASSRASPGKNLDPEEVTGRSPVFSSQRKRLETVCVDRESLDALDIDDILDKDIKELVSQNIEIRARSHSRGSGRQSKEKTPMKSQMSAHQEETKSELEDFLNAVNSTMTRKGSSNEQSDFSRNKLEDERRIINNVKEAEIHFETTSAGLKQMAREDSIIRERTAVKEGSTARERPGVRESSAARDRVGHRESSTTRDRPAFREGSTARERPAFREGSMARERSKARERSVARAVSQAREIIRERSVARGETGREMTLPRDLGPLANHILNLSSATIPDDLTMSCASIIDRFPQDLDGIETEKELLIKRLKELLDVERNQVAADLQSKKQQLLHLEETFKSNMAAIEARHQTERREMSGRHRKELEELEKEAKVEEKRIQTEILKLEDELEAITRPVLLLTTLSTPEQPSKTTSPNLQDAGLEAELTCCGCFRLCAPPCKIYQCPDGDLVCEVCRHELEGCPTCGIQLAGQTSRNKVLESIAKKYFKS